MKGIQTCIPRDDPHNMRVLMRWSLCELQTVNLLCCKLNQSQWFIVRPRLEKELQQQEKKQQTIIPCMTYCHGTLLIDSSQTMR